MFRILKIWQGVSPNVKWTHSGVFSLSAEGHFPVPPHIRIAGMGAFCMGKRPRREGFLERTAQALDIPVEATGLPRVEVTGRHEVRMENHKGILAYGREEIIVSGGKLLIKVKGDGLELKAMNGDELLITGTVTAVELE